MAKKNLILKDFSGGFGTTSEKRDVANSARFIKDLNPFEDPSYITLARKPSKVSGNTVDGLVYWAEDGSPYSTSRYFYDSGGKIYQETSAGAWSSLRTVSGGAGDGLKVFDDYLYYALTAGLGRYGKLSGTPAFDDNFIATAGDDVDQTGGGTGAADYVPPTSIAETATARQTFTPEQDPLKAIVIDVDVVGSGVWTVTVHDSNNTAIGSKSIVNGSMAIGDNTFTFATPLRVVIGNEYHFHVTSTVADGGVDTDAATDLEGAEFSTTFGVLIASTFHPMATVEDTLIIGNERYLATWDQSSYNPNTITFDPGFEVRSIAKFEEFIVAAAIKGGSVSAGEEARLYFWDGIVASTIVSYNFYTDVTIGMPNAIHNAKGKLFGVYGNKGAMYLGNDPFEDVVHEIPSIARDKKLEVFPGAVTEHGGRTLIGVGSTDDATLYQGVYEFGKQQSYLPSSFNYPYTISTGTVQATTLQIGMVKSMGTDLYIGWRDDTAYGVDKIAIDAGANASGSYETLIFDGGDPNRQMLPLNVKVEYETLTTGQTVTPKYKLDRAASFTGGTAGAVGSDSVEAPIYTRCYEIEFGFDVASTGNTYPKITGLILEYDPLEKED